MLYARVVERRNGINYKSDARLISAQTVADVCDHRAIGSNEAFFGTLILNLNLISNLISMISIRSV